MRDRRKPGVGRQPSTHVSSAASARLCRHGTLGPGLRRVSVRLLFLQRLPTSLSRPWRRRCVRSFRCCASRWTFCGNVWPSTFLCWTWPALAPTVRRARRALRRDQARLIRGRWRRESPSWSPAPWTRHRIILQFHPLSKAREPAMLGQRAGPRKKLPLPRRLCQIRHVIPNQSGTLLHQMMSLEKLRIPLAMSCLARNLMRCMIIFLRLVAKYRRVPVGTRIPGRAWLLLGQKMRIAMSSAQHYCSATWVVA
mmetsp:Transcript_26433/g.56097  ORF Transcript_26433/g.56097 Transcript_26433/m.56097 type:complete len:253 (+) Transcript_26433:881-1639(+)